MCCVCDIQANAINCDIQTVQLDKVEYRSIGKRLIGKDDYRFQWHESYASPMN